MFGFSWFKNKVVLKIVGPLNNSFFPISKI
jgi:hypothetical protein